MGAALQGESMDFLDILRHEAQKAKKRKAQAQKCELAKSVIPCMKTLIFWNFSLNQHGRPVMHKNRYRWEILAEARKREAVESVIFGIFVPVALVLVSVSFVLLNS